MSLTLSPALLFLHTFLFPSLLPSPAKNFRPPWITQPTASAPAPPSRCRWALVQPRCSAQDLLPLFFVGLQLFSHPAMDMLQGGRSEVGVAASGRGGCCQRRTGGGRSCYKGRLDLLQGAGGGSGCCRRRTALLQRAARVATAYKGRPELLLGLEADAVCLLRTTCYKGLPELLQGAAGVAARGRRRCSLALHGTTACSGGMTTLLPRHIRACYQGSSVFLTAT
jgi:hypothetical protein